MRASSYPFRIAVLFVGGMHQALHIAPVAVELARTDRAEVSAFVMTHDDARALETMLRALGAPSISIIPMLLPWMLEWLMQFRSFKPMSKVIRLFYWNRAIRRHGAILAAERTSTILRQMPGRTPPMIHIPHGTGDRAKGFEPRIALFDHVIVAGEKDRRRMIADNLVTPDRCTVSGAIKIAAVRQLRGADARRLFANDRPVILYNPHFRDSLASWQDFAAPLIDAVVKDGRYNLIVAPHIRRFEQASDELRAEWRSRGVDDRVLIDLSSHRLNDMTYVDAADIYLGDVSSQIYEFLTNPRPAIFIDAHAAEWQDNPDYAMWRFGPVCQTIGAIMHEIETASQRHRGYVGIQRAAIADALGRSGARAPAIAAQQVFEVFARNLATRDAPVRVAADEVIQTS